LLTLTTEMLSTGSKSSPSELTLYMRVGFASLDVL
jgi:hypothetical protein